jgi:transcription antitermination factor NusG
MNRSDLGWYAVTCRPQSELLAQRALRSRGVDAVVPTERRWRRRHGGRRPRVADHPLMPGYVLLPARSAGAACALVHGHPVLRRLVDDRPIPPAELRRLEAACGREVIRLDQHAAPLAPGQAVLVTHGPWAWHTGRLQRLLRDHADVLLTAFGVTQPVRLPLANLAAT